MGIYFVFGLNGFLNFLPMPPMENPVAQAYMGGLAGTGYFFPILKATEVICGLLLLPGTPLVIVVFVLHLILAWGYQASYKPLFVKKTSPK